MTPVSYWQDYYTEPDAAWLGLLLAPHIGTRLCHQVHALSHDEFMLCHPLPGPCYEILLCWNCYPQGIRHKMCHSVAPTR